MSRWSLLLSMEGGKKQSPSHSSYNWNNVRNNHEIHSTKHIQRKDWLGFSEKCYEAEENLLQNWGNWFARVHVNYFRSDYYPYITNSIDKRLKFLQHHWLEQELRENFAPSHWTNFVTNLKVRRNGNLESSYCTIWYFVILVKTWAELPIQKLRKTRNTNPKDGRDVLEMYFKYPLLPMDRKLNKTRKVKRHIMGNRKSCRDRSESCRQLVGGAKNFPVRRRQKPVSATAPHHQTSFPTMKHFIFLFNWQQFQFLVCLFISRDGRLWLSERRQRWSLFCNSWAISESWLEQDLA